MRRRIRRALKRWLGTLFGRLLAHLARRGVLPQPERVLVVRVDERVGNLLMTLPLARAVAAGFPEARVDFLVAASKVDLAEGSFRVVPFCRRDAFFRPLRLVRLLFELRRARYDIAVDASHWHRPSLTASVLVAWSGAPMRVGHARARIGVRRLAKPGAAGASPGYHTHLVSNPEREEPEVETKLRLLRPLGLERPRSVEVRLSLGTRQPTAVRMRAWLAGQGVMPEGFAAVCPGARKAGHRVDPEVFVSMAGELSARGLVSVVLWGPGERALAETVAVSVGGAVCAPPTDLAELAALLVLSSVAVTNDTGPMHLAVASGVRTLSLFRGSSETRWRHPVAWHRVVRAAGRCPRAVVADAVGILDAWIGPPLDPPVARVVVSRDPTVSLGSG